MTYFNPQGTEHERRVASFRRRVVLIESYVQREMRELLNEEHTWYDNGAHLELCEAIHVAYRGLFLEAYKAGVSVTEIHSNLYAGAPQ